MANIEDAGGTFTLERLRSADAARLGAATSGVSAGPLQLPVVRGVGPDYDGPSGTQIAGEHWIVRFAVPAVPEVCWVVSRVLPQLLAKFSGQWDNMGVWAGVDAANATWRRSGPVWSSPLAAIRIDATATYDWAYVPTTVNQATSLSQPLDPEDTKDGFDVAVSVAAAAAVAADDAALCVAGIELLGYPVNLWGTGLIAGRSALRGS
jgi:hypothetical protein